MKELSFILSVLIYFLALPRYSSAGETQSQVFSGVKAASAAEEQKIAKKRIDRLTATLQKELHRLIALRDKRDAKGEKLKQQKEKLLYNSDLVDKELENLRTRISFDSPETWEDRMNHAQTELDKIQENNKALDRRRQKLRTKLNRITQSIQSRNGYNLSHMMAYKQSILRDMAKIPLKINGNKVFSLKDTIEIARSKSEEHRQQLLKQKEKYKVQILEINKILTAHPEERISELQAQITKLTVESAILSVSPQVTRKVHPDRTGRTR